MRGVLGAVCCVLGVGACRTPSDPFAGLSGEQLTATVLSVRPDSVDGEWRPTGILQYRWVRGAPPYLLIREDPTTQDTAELIGTRLRIRWPGHEDVLVEDSVGWGLFEPDMLAMDSSVFARELADSTNLFVFPSVYGKNGAPTLALIGYQFGSSPGSFHLLTVTPEGVPVEVMRARTFDPDAALDLDGDGVVELVGKYAWGEGMSSTNARGCALGSYAPYSVIRFSGSPVPKATEDSALSRIYNEAHYAWYDGPDPDHALVQWCPGNKYKLTRTND